MHLYWKMIPLAILILPAPSWGCSGTWTGAVDDTWTNPGNWGGPCTGPGVYPGETLVNDTAAFSTVTPQLIINLNTSPSALGGLAFDIISYTINDPTATHSLTINSGATISVAGGNQAINVPVSFSGGGTFPINISGSASSLTFTQPVTGATNISLNGMGSGTHTLNNLNNAIGFQVANTLSLNSSSDGSASFINKNSNPIITLSTHGSFVSADTISINGTSGNVGYLNYNTEFVTSNSEGALTVANKIVLNSTDYQTATLTCLNEGVIFGAVSNCSQIKTNFLSGRGHISVINKGGAVGSVIFPGAGGVIQVQNDFDIEGLLEITNFSDEVNGAKGALFQAIQNGSFQDVIITNHGNSPTTAILNVGALLSGGGSLTFKGNTQIINDGNVGSNLGVLIGSGVEANGSMIFTSNTEIINNGNVDVGGIAFALCGMNAGGDLIFNGIGTTSSLINNGTFQDPATLAAGVNIITSSNFIKKGTGILNMINEGSIQNGPGTGFGIVLTAGLNIEMAEGEWNLLNKGDLNGGLGLAIEGTHDFLMSGGNLTLTNLAPVSGGGIGAGIETNDFIQTGGVFTINQSPTDSVDTTSLGSFLNAQNSLFISGGTFKNNENVFLANNVYLSGLGVVEGIGTFSKVITILPFSNSKEPFNLFENAGRVRPGNSPGVLHLVCDDYVQTPEGTLEIHILNGSGPGPEGYSQLNIIGAASLDGTLEVVLDPGFSICEGNQFTILEASEGRTGEFSTVLEANFANNISPMVTYFPNSVVLSFLICPCLSEYIGNFTQTLFTSITDTNNFFIKRQLQRVQERTQETANKHLGNIYFGPIGSVGQSDHVGSQVGFNYWSAGAVLGADRAFNQGGVGGLVIYENIKSDDVDCNWGNLRTQRAHASLYGTYIPPKMRKLALDLMLGGGYDWYQIHRQRGNGTAKGSPNGYEVDGMFSLEYTLTKKEFHLVPMANLQYVYLHVNSYNEERGFDYSSQKAKSLSTVLGLWADKTWKGKHPLTAQVNLGWQREYLNHDRTLHYSNQTLQLEGAERNNLLAGIDLLLQLNEKWKLEASYDLIWNKQFDRNGFYLGLNAAF